MGLGDVRPELLQQIDKRMEPDLSLAPADIGQRVSKVRQTDSPQQHVRRENSNRGSPTNYRTTSTARLRKGLSSVQRDPLQAQERKLSPCPTLKCETADPTNTLFIGNLCLDADATAVKSLFNTCAEVVDVRLPKDAVSGEHKGFGYVRFGTAYEARYALNALQGRRLKGRSMRLDFSQPQNVESDENTTIDRRGSQNGSDEKHFEEPDDLQEPSRGIYLHYTISEDRCGSNESVMAAMLSRLGARSKPGQLRQRSGPEFTLSRRSDPSTSLVEECITGRQEDPRSRRNSLLPEQRRKFPNAAYHAYKPRIPTPEKTDSIKLRVGGFPERFSDATIASFLYARFPQDIDVVVSTRSVTLGRKFAQVVVQRAQVEAFTQIFSGDLVDEGDSRLQIGPLIGTDRFWDVDDFDD